MKAQRRCVECGAEVHGQGRHVYCSDVCKLITRTCLGCGDEFQTERKRKGRNFHCSLKCRPRNSATQITSIAVKCGHCEKPMMKPPSVLADGRGKYCSRSCAAMSRPINGKPSKIADDSIDLFLRSTPMLCELEKRVGRWSIDLAVPLHQIAVELDGEYWHSLPAMVEKDHRKDAWLNDHGWRVVRIVIAKRDTPESVARRIAKELDSCPTVAA